MAVTALSRFVDCVRGSSLPHQSPPRCDCTSHQPDRPSAPRPSRSGRRRQPAPRPSVLERAPADARCRRLPVAPADGMRSHRGRERLAQRQRDVVRVQVARLFVSTLAGRAVLGLGHLAAEPEQEVPLLVDLLLEGGQQRFGVGVRQVQEAALALEPGRQRLLVARPVVERVGAAVLDLVERPVAGVDGEAGEIDASRRARCASRAGRAR